MNDEELLAAVKRDWEHWAGHLGLQNWRPQFLVDDDLGGSMSLAWVSPYKKVTFNVLRKPTVPELDHRPDIFSQDVLHECIHLATAALRNWAYKEFDGNGTNWQGFMTAWETVTDELTSIISRLHAETGCNH